MKSTISLILWTCLWSTTAYAQNRNAADPPSKCPVGEPAGPQPGPCNTNGNQTTACDQYCAQIFGSSTNGKCVGRNGIKRECICDAGCVNSGCWGDPHCGTFDGVQFDYFGLCRHMLLNTTQSAFPHFQLNAKNKQLIDGESATLPNELDLIISSWGISLRIGENLQVNGGRRATPYRYSTVVDTYKEQFVEVTTKVVVKQIGGVVERVLVYTVVTSFGLIVQKETPVSEHGQMYGVYVHIPRHPHLMGHTSGLLGNWDEDRSNDMIDADGNKHDLQGPFGLAAWLFGDSWCLDPKEVTSMRMALHHLAIHKERLKDCSDHPMKNRTMNELCSKLRNAVFLSCLGNDGVERVTSQCHTDLCYARTQAEEQTAFCNAVEASNQQCGAAVPCG